jgi:hypothetical protein
LERPRPEQVEGVLGCIGAAGGRDDRAVRVSRGGVWAAEAELMDQETKEHEAATYKASWHGGEEFGSAYAEVLAGVVDEVKVALVTATLHEYHGLEQRVLQVLQGLAALGPLLQVLREALTVLLMHACIVGRLHHRFTRHRRGGEGEACAGRWARAGIRVGIGSAKHLGARNPVQRERVEHQGVACTGEPACVGGSKTLAGRGFEFVSEDEAVGSPAARNQEGRIVEGG